MFFVGDSITFQDNYPQAVIASLNASNNADYRMSPFKDGNSGFTVYGLINGSPNSVIDTDLAARAASGSRKPNFIQIQMGVNDVNAGMPAPQPNDPHSQTYAFWLDDPDGSGSGIRWQKNYLTLIQKIAAVYPGAPFFLVIPWYNNSDAQTDLGKIRDTNLPAVVAAANAAGITTYMGFSVYNALSPDWAGRTLEGATPPQTHPNATGAGFEGTLANAIISVYFH